MEAKLTTKLKAVEERVIQITLSSAAKAQYQLGKVSSRELATLVSLLKALSDSYISGKSVIMSQMEVSAYALYYLPINLAKLHYLLKNQLSAESGLPLRILDFGCGPGSGALACLDMFGTDTEITLFDKSKNCLNFAADLIHSINPLVKINKLEETKSLSGQKYDLIIAANVLTEMDLNQRFAAYDLLSSAVKENGYLLILDPALKDKTQALMRDRDHFLKSYPRFSVRFPCTHQADCPMLKDSADNWCHGQIPANSWQAPPLCSQLDKLLGFNKHRIKYSAFIYKQQSCGDSDSARVIQTSSNKYPASICCAEGLLQIRTTKVKDIATRRALKATENFSLVSTDLCII